MENFLGSKQKKTHLKKERIFTFCLQDFPFKKLLSLVCPPPKKKILCRKQCIDLGLW